MDGLIGIAVFVLVIVLTTFIFFGWIAVMIIKGVVGIISSATKATLRPPPVPRVMTQNQPHMLRCQTHGWHAMNPASARFCRRCGRGMPAAQHVQVRRAAVW